MKHPKIMRWSNILGGALVVWMAATAACCAHKPPRPTADACGPCQPSPDVLLGGTRGCTDASTLTRYVQQCAAKPTEGSISTPLAHLNDCSERETATLNWLEDLSTNPAGAVVVDDLNAHIGAYAAKKTIVMWPFTWTDWFPLDGSKHALCGNLNHFSVYDGRPWNAHERDWNAHIVPTATYMPLYDRAKPFATAPDISSSWKLCGDDPCIEAEITPHDALFYNMWFPLEDSDHSPLKGQIVCVYGPWVREYLHGNKPEIHPAEVLWWRETHDPPNVVPAANGVSIDAAEVRFLHVMDESERFDDPGKFALPDAPFTGWKPWGKPPSAHSVYLPFRVDVGSDALEFYVSEFSKRNVIENQGNSATGDAGIAVIIDGAGAVVAKTSATTAHGELGMSFGSVCKSDKQVVRGYLRIQSVIGEGGFQAFSVVAAKLHRDYKNAPNGITVASAIPEKTSSTPVAVIQDAKVPAGSERILYAPQLKSVFLGDTAMLLATIPPTTSAGEVAVAQVLGPDIPVAAITEGPATGKPTYVDHALTPIIRARPRTFASTDGPLGPAVLGKAGGPGTNPFVKETREWHIELSPLYSAQQGGRPLPEDDGAVADKLNSVLAKGSDNEVREIFGKKPPFSVSWKFRCVRVRTGEDLGVSADGSGGACVALISRGSRGRDSVVVVFPEGEKELLSLTAVATVKDVFGTEGRAEHAVWNAVARLDEGALDRIVASLCGASGSNTSGTDTLMTSAPNPLRIARVTAEGLAQEFGYLDRSQVSQLEKTCGVQ